MQQTLKKWVSVILALTLALSMAACSGGSTDSSQSGASSAVSSTAEASSEASGESSTVTTTSAYSEGIEDDGYFTGITALDYVTLPDYENIEVPEGTGDVSDEDLQTEFDNYLTQFNETTQVTDQAVEDGDLVNIDYVGSVDGVEFDGGNSNGNGSTVTAGSTQFIDDFLTQIIGHMPGETFDVNVTFPDEYSSNPDLAGKEAVFVTTINYIEKEAYTEITDEFVTTELKDLYGWNNKAEMEEAVEAYLSNTAIGNYIWQQILEQVEVSEMPQEMSDYQSASMTNYYTAMASQYGFTLDEFLTQQGIESIDILKEQNADAIAANEKSSLVMQALCEDMGIEVTGDDMADFFLYQMYTDDYSLYVENYGLPYLRMLAREDMALQRLGNLG